MIGDLLIAFSLGLLSAPHCIGMCGSIATALLVSAQRSKKTQNDTQVVRFVAAGAAPAIPQPAFAHHALQDAFWFGSGKLLAYVTLGVVVGSVGLAIGTIGSAPTMALRGVSALLMIAIGLYIAGWWRGIAHWEALGARVWQPALRRFGRFDMHHNSHKLFAGALWGLLPCGIVYSALGLALTSGSVGKAAAMMASFGIGTLPFVLSAGGVMQVAANRLASPVLKKCAGMAMILLGLVSLALLLGMSASPHSH